MSPTIASVTTSATLAILPRCASTIRDGTSPSRSTISSPRFSRALRPSAMRRRPRHDTASMYDLIIEPCRKERNYWRDLWRYRELFQVLAWRDVSVRYKQTVIGIMWALIRPFLTMLVLTIVFGRIARLPADGNVPYA